MDREGRRRGGQGGPGGASPIYGLGLIGAAVWYWQQTDDPGQRALGVLKATAWPAFLVHGAYQTLQNGSGAKRKSRRR